ncbi:hypothetical protein AFZ15_11840 [Listeria monocytogenes]|uniref:Uncharacterized protein n=3 Tax=Listeria monocytogenes TaxID=1639 RepID=A0A3T2E001_LISMN|nr:hypothetical protein JU62_00375 [Listeria monocytogenes]EAG6271884.1 hypothetical protein [Listeria monocytogenes CFSAN003726]EAG6275152.1 hypothetical protein [Listeria monocytogenes CFSAN003808]EAG6281365.1 hypothetical protein [Listeria monocytogenes CFSAN003809]EAG6360005.1 hypothetical protein [Listeria monocytogenes CFSAN003729]EAG6368891.1 hypothetical protein [Listeria monocytogenes CFSAN003728]EAH4395560.1 hypothetical protein [Listeria monocytogenes serotype 3a]EHC5244404.1 hypo
MIAATLFLTGCGNGDAEKIDTEEQIKSVEEEGKEVKIESNEGKPQHEQLITVKLPPEADYLNDETLEVYEQDKKKYDQTNQLITNDSITLLVGDYGYYDPIWGSLDCSFIIVNGTKSTVKDLSFQISIEDNNNVISGKVFLDSTVQELAKTQIGDLQPNTGVPIVLSFPEKNTTGEDEDKKIDTKNVKIHISNIQYKVEK